MALNMDSVCSNQRKVNIMKEHGCTTKRKVMMQSLLTMMVVGMKDPTPPTKNMAQEPNPMSTVAASTESSNMALLPTEPSCSEMVPNFKAIGVKIGSQGLAS